MKLIHEPNALRVIRENGDPKFYGTKNAAGESRLLYQVVKLLRAESWDVIKKRMYKDGHLVDAMQQYIRTLDGNTVWFNDHWAICGLNDNFNDFGEARLQKV